MASIDLEVVKHALSVAREHGFAEVELANGDARFSASLEAIPRKKKAAAVVQTPIQSDPISGLFPIKAGFVGYLRSAGSKLAVGQSVDKGESVASIATLGLSNDVEASATGEIVEVLVNDGDPVQFGQVLAQVKP